MKSAIKKIFENEQDDILHGDFIKFGKGTFKDKYLVEAKKQKDLWSIKTSNEFANFLVRTCAEESKDDSIQASGVIVSTFDLRAGMGGYVFKSEEEIKQFMGIKQLKVDSIISKKRLLEVMDKFPRAFFALSFSNDKSQLKIKAKAPKSSKPASGGEKGPSADFCSIKTSDNKIINDLLFDCSNASQVKINHDIQIDEIIIPKGIEDPVKMREMSKRKGKIIRTVNSDQKENKSYAPFQI